MDIKVLYSELDDVIKSINENSTLMDEQIKYLKESVNELKGNWSGYDADVFYDSVIPFLNELTQIPEFYREITIVADNMNNTYQEVDNSYTEELKKSVVQHE